MIKQLIRGLSHTRSLRTLSSLDAYAHWAATYPPHAHNVLMQTEEQAMLDFMPDLAGKAVLDLACGTGRYGLIALKRGATAVIELDNSPAMLQANTLQWRALATTQTIPLATHSVDVVLCGLALGHLPDLKVSFREISRVLKDGGYALISDFHPFLFLNGQRRTFTAASGKIYAVEHYPHLYADYHRAAEQVGLQIDGIAEPKMANKGGKNITPSVPIVIVFRLHKLT